MCWITTFSGKTFHVLDPQPNEVALEDVAHALALTNRFSGHTRFPYSVAQHSVLVSNVVPPELMLQGLLHDSAEAYITDIPTPLKKKLEDIQEIERRICIAVGDALGVNMELKSDAVKDADLRMFETECRDLMSNLRGYYHDVLPYDMAIVPWSWQEAKERFLWRFHTLKGLQRGKEARQMDGDI